MLWLWIILALIYLISPYDLLPDFLPIRGWLDDIVVLFFLFRYIKRLRGRRPDPNQSGHQQHHGRQESGEADPTRPRNKTPYDILGVAPNASCEEIHKAYRKLVNQYHPDKVAHLGQEFQDMAEKRFKEIQHAYEQIKNGKER